MTGQLPGGGGQGEIDLLLPPGQHHTPPPHADTHPVRLAGETMGTGWSLDALVTTALSTDAVEAALLQAFETVIAQMSQWRADSQISRFNSGAPGSEHRIGPQFRLVLDCAMAISQASDGAFHPALGAAAQAWGFGAAKFDGAKPTGKVAPADWSSLAGSAPDRIVQPGGVRLDLSGIAKGFAVDLAMAALQRCGFGHALLDIGGELKGIGLRADGLPWWVDLEQREDSVAMATRIGLTGWAVATSGHWHRRRSAGTDSWSHTLDPATGAPVGDALSATVLHPGCMQADALATALIVLGEARAMAFADRHNLAARLVTGTQVLESAAWQRWRA